MIRQIAPAASQNAGRTEALSLAGLAAALEIEHTRLVRRAWWLYGLATACVVVAVLWGGSGGPGYALLLALAALLGMGAWLGSARWRTLLIALGPPVFHADRVGDIDALLDIGRFLELAPIFLTLGPDGTRTYPCSDRTREVTLALGRLLPRLELAEARAMTFERRRYLERCVIRSGGRVDPHFGPEFLVAALLTLGPTGDARVWRAVERLKRHHDIRVCGAASECLRLLGKRAE